MKFSTNIILIYPIILINAIFKYLPAFIKTNSLYFLTYFTYLLLPFIPFFYILLFPYIVFLFPDFSLESCPPLYFPSFTPTLIFTRKTIINLAYLLSFFHVNFQSKLLNNLFLSIFTLSSKLKPENSPNTQI